MFVITFSSWEGANLNHGKSNICFFPLHFQSFEDEELYTLILKRHLVTAAVETAFYPQLVVHILSSQCSEDSETPDYIRLESVAKELQDAGYQAEAGNLVMQFRSTHRSLRTFDAAFSVLSRLFHRS